MLNIMKPLLLILIVPLLSFGQINKYPKHYISIGFLDHKTGSSIVGYTRSILQNKNNELFVGAGTLLAQNTFVVGFKKYLLRSFVDGYSVISMQSIYGMGRSGFSAPAVSIGVEKKIWKMLFINIGANSIIRVYSDNRIEFINLPHLNINIRF